MHVLNQDRDMMVIYNHLSSIITFAAVFSKEVFIGFNLMIDGNLMGTFDSMREVVEESDRIIECPHDYYIISGYSAWDDWKTLTSDWGDEDE